MIRNLPPWLLMAAYIIGIVVVVGLMVRMAPDAEDRFDRCMALADRSGLTEARREEAALICLDNATRRSGRNRDGPIVVPSTTDGSPTVIP